MKKTIQIMAMMLVMMAFAISTASAQKVKVHKGKLDFIKNENVKKFNVEYDYSEMSVGKFDREEDYVKEKVKEKNEDEPGTGDEWKYKWEDDREARFEPKFEELMNEYLKKDGVKTGRYDDAKYTIILKTTHTEPGFNVGVMRRPAHINVDVWFVETANRSNVLAKAKIEKVPGQDAMGFDFDTGYRLQEAYAKAGKQLAKHISKKVL